MRNTPFLATIVAVLMLSGFSLAQPPNDIPYGDEWVDEALDLAQQAGMFGALAFDEEAGTAQGAFVEAEIDLATGGLLSYRLVVGPPVGPVAPVHLSVFAEVEVASMAPFPAACTEAESGPASLTLDCPAVSLRVHNDPTRALLYQAKQDVTLRFVADAGTFLARQDGSVLVGGPGFSGQLTLLAGEGASLVTEGDTLEVTLPADGKVAFRAEPQDDEGAVGPWAQGAVFKAMALHRLGGELFLVALEGGILEDAVPYGDLAFASRLVTPSHLEITVTSPRPDGALVAVNLHRDVLDVEDLDRLGVELNGVPVPRTANVDLLPTVAEEPLHYVAAGPNGFFLLVHIPEFSTQVLTIRDVETFVRELTSQTLLLVGLGALVTVLAAAALLRRGRGGW